MENRNSRNSDTMTSPRGNIPVIKTAVYTRKSSEEGLEQEFNSLDAQREACKAYIASQKHEGWVLVEKDYSDGGISGGTLNRPAIQELLQDIKDGLVNMIVVYKIDRLTRSPTVQPSTVHVVHKGLPPRLLQVSGNLRCPQRLLCEHYPAV